MIDKREIERLQAVEEAARNAFEVICEPAYDGENYEGRQAIDWLRTALSGKRLPITDEMVRRAADAMPHHEEPSFWWTDPTQREILRRVMDAAING